MSVRAVRNNNPGNIESGPTWLGLMPRSQMNPEQAAEPRFAVFQDPAHGFRAMGVVLLNYERLHKLSTVRGYITRWAPPNENDTAAYVSHAAQECGVGPDDRYDLYVEANLVKLLRVISKHEVGSWAFQEADLKRGADMAIGNGGLVA